MNERPDGRDGRRELLGAVRLRRDRRKRRQREREPPLAAYLGQVGVLGWMIVVPALVGVFVGRWLDHRLGTGVFWTAPLMLAGLGFGCWSAWKWMHR